MPHEITAGRLRQLFHYDPETGEFTKRERTDTLGKRYKAGKLAGYSRPGGRVQIRVDGRLYYRSRLAWLYVYGSWPKNEGDHIDRDPANDRIANLRDATRSENSVNRTTGWHKNSDAPRGVRRVKQARRIAWAAQVCIDCKSTYLGTFATKEEAHEAYLAAAAKVHGEFLP